MFLSGASGLFFCLAAGLDPKARREYLERKLTGRQLRAAGGPQGADTTAATGGRPAPAIMAPSCPPGRLGAVIGLRRTRSIPFRSRFRTALKGSFLLLGRTDTLDVKLHTPVEAIDTVFFLEHVCQLGIAVTEHSGIVEQNRT